MTSDDAGDSLNILARIKELAPPDDPRLSSTIAALHESLRLDQSKQAEAAERLQEFEDAYTKLTAPANRLGVFLRWLTDEEIGDAGHRLALVALGDADYVCEADPKSDLAKLCPGVRVRLNEAFAILGTMPSDPSGKIEKASAVLDDGRIRIGGGPQGAGDRIVGRSEAVADAEIHPGDEVRLDPSGRLVAEAYQASDVRDYFLEDVPELPWDKIGGQAEAIQLIKETIEQPLLHPELFKRFDKKPIKGVLLYGPPGCGKTLIGKAAAYNLTKEYSARVGKPVKEYFMAISGPKILSMWLGETERMVREIFHTAREKAKSGQLVFIFVDEAESLLRTRSSGRWLNISNTVVPQFCAELDGLHSLENVVLILTSNRPDYIDPAVLRPERIDRKVKVGRPDKTASAQILSIYLHDQIPLDAALLKRFEGDPDCARQHLIEGLLHEFWEASKKNEFLKVNLKNGTSDILYFKDVMSGALLKSVVDRAKDTAIKRAIAHPKDEPGIVESDLMDAMRQEFRENEIFPKSDLTEDWLELLDYPAENVASVKPVKATRGESLARRSIV